MKKNVKITLGIFFIAFALFFTLTGGITLALSELNEPTEPIQIAELTHHPLIAHAGGHIYGYRYTNSLEAIESSYNNGFKLIELDFEWTLDDEIVLIHDWDSMVKRMLMTEPRVLTLEEFKNEKSFQDLTLMDLEDLANYLEVKKDLYIVTDVKSRNLEFLETIAANYGGIKLQIIPQVYSFDEYEKAKELGFENIILTLYRSTYSNEEIIEFVKDNPLFAITMNLDKGYSELPLRLKELDVISYVHTVNDLYIFEELSENGVYGIYTDYFQANQWINDDMEESVE